MFFLKRQATWFNFVVMTLFIKTLLFIVSWSYKRVGL